MKEKKNKRVCKEREQYYVDIEGQLIEVSREVYLAYYQGRRKEQYLYERDKSKGLSFFGDFDYEIIAADYSDVEEEYIRKEEYEKLGRAIATLSDEEIGIIRDLYYLQHHQNEIVKKYGMSTATLSRRKKEILEKLKKVL